jgi:hypothetical protein
MYGIHTQANWEGGKNVAHTSQKSRQRAILPDGATVVGDCSNWPSPGLCTTWFGITRFASSSISLNVRVRIEENIIGGAWWWFFGFVEFVEFFSDTCHEKENF